jgi:membrane-associated phospholipid phosphatase
MTLHDSERAGAPSRHDAFPIPFRWKLALPGILALLLAVAMAPATDRTYPLLYDLARKPGMSFLVFTKQFASLFSILTIAAIVWTMDRSRRAALGVLIVALLAASLANESIKTLTARARPTYSVALARKNRAWIEQYIQVHPKARMRADGHDQWLWLSSQRPFYQDPYLSFPSGHANTAFVLAAFLIVLYPRMKWGWLIVAVGCALARVAQRRHFPEDILFGGGLGWLMACWVFSLQWPIALGRRLFEDGKARDATNGKNVPDA